MDRVDRATSGSTPGVTCRRRSTTTVGSALRVLLLVTLLAPSALAQTLRDVITANGIPVAPGGPAQLDAPITDYAMENAPDLFAIAYYVPEDDRPALSDTVHVSVWDRVRHSWTHAALARHPPDWDLGSIVAIHHTARFLLLDSHTTPSAGMLGVLTRTLAPVTALPGWLLEVLPDDVVLYHRNMAHFAPTHSAELWTWDPKTGRDARLYPNQPWDSVRQAYIDTTRAIYQRVGEHWFNAHNHHMDPERFDTTLEDSVVVDATGHRVAFRMRFGGGEGTPAETPSLEVVVICRDVGSARAACSETPLATLQRRYPQRRPIEILHDLLGNR
jgi:hypothetical protein